ncbi:potassium channel family protein [Blastopirellula retiformator]|uniref:Ktr system potassium uptake protein A n=1 Tax=Blastopirellula retiformator TaxID=2527970 RepID=A0A5C5V4T4_9BACT|nr:potassium channel protein [Blastopirellula retiformator]TWT33070.1 Ktr system potassium uptake protein A [Blastopirellula retiformator]
MESDDPFHHHDDPERPSPLSAPIRKMVTGAVLFLMICVVAVVGYVSAGWDLADSIYMVIITIFGVGYGEVQPVQSIPLRALTIMVIIAGYGAVIYTVGGFMQMVVDGELQKALKARRMTKEIEKLTGHTILCGVGRMGSILARELHAEGKLFVVIDSDEARLAAAEALGYLIVKGDATEEWVLEQAGIHRAALLTTVLSADATNVFVTVTAREMNPELTIIARGENPRTEKKLIGCGANKVVLPTAIGAKKLAQMIIRPSAENLLEQLTHRSDLNEELGRIGLHFDELEVAPGSSLVNKPLGEIELRSNHGFLIVGIRHPDGSTILNPPPESRLIAGDIVIVLGHDDDIPQLAERFSSSKGKIMYRGAIIDAD